MPHTEGQPAIDPFIDPFDEQGEGLGGLGPAFCVLWATGEDTTLDGILRIEARRCRDGKLESFEAMCDPLLSSPGEISDCTARDFGLDGRDVAAALESGEAWRRLVSFLGNGPIVTPDAGALRAWSRFFGTPELAHRAIGLVDLARLLLPGRYGEQRADLMGSLVGRERELSAPLAWTTRDLRLATARLIGGFLDLEPRILRLAVCGWLAAWRGLLESDPLAARQLALALRLADSPSTWSISREELSELHPGLRDGVLSGLLSPAERERPADRVRDLVENLNPLCHRLGAEALRLETVPPRTDAPKVFSDEDMRLVDDVFEVHLPALFSKPADGEGGPYRSGQHQVARNVARTLGSRELLLVHAPTGTGKTLAYLVPAMIWSVRHGVRVGVSTYTRTLQEQALRHEVPRARRALLAATSLGSRAALSCEPRVTLLKGRNNYLCWRALKLQTPGADDDPAQWLAWLALCLFALTDENADLDHFPPRPALAGERAAAYARELGAIVRHARAFSSCCTTREDRESCGAEVARARAERSHVVIANHSFSLARQDFFRHVVFDECEHLHDQAHGAWSITIAVRDMREGLARLRQEGRLISHAPFDQLERVAPDGSKAREVLDECLAHWEAASDGVGMLEVALKTFKDWRSGERRRRHARDEHSLLREYVLHADARALLAARCASSEGLRELSSGLTALIECIETVPMRSPARLRRALEIERAAVEELAEGLEAWIPMRDGKPALQTETFYDVEEDPRRKDVLAARVLLPNEYLGRYYYPQLENAVLISATTWLCGGFEAALGYLGLDRAADPLETDEREPCHVRTFHAPDPFDYTRVLACVPTDAPAYGDKTAFDAYVREFIAHLGERTRGRMLCLFTNAADVRRIGADLAGFFRARRIPFWFQGMPGLAKEELGRLFRARTDSILLGVDTFWYGADFPGETLEYLVLTKLPYGVPDRYHQAQCAALGASDQRRRIYMPRALAKFRQGFGRLMRRETDRGCVFVLDSRVLEGRHKAFLAELPLADERFRGEDEEWSRERAKLLTLPTDECVHAALAHMDMLADVRRRQLDVPFRSRAGDSRENTRERSPEPEPEPRIEVSPEDLPF
jgi:Rad3-related DNA helicase